MRKYFQQKPPKKRLFSNYIYAHLLQKVSTFMVNYLYGGVLLRSEYVPDEIKKKFGRLISKKRKEKRLHLKDIAKHCGVSLNFISLIERGIKSPSDNVIVKLSEVLEIDEDILFQTLEKIPPSIKENVSTAIHEHDGFKELLAELSDKVKDEKLREKLYEEVYEVYLDFLKRNNLDKE